MGYQKWENGEWKVKNDRWVNDETPLGTKTMGQWINEASEKASLGEVQNGGYLTRWVRRYRAQYPRLTEGKGTYKYWSLQYLWPLVSERELINKQATRTYRDTRGYMAT